MATVRIGRRDVELRYPQLRPFEAAWVLGRSEREVRNMLRRGALRPTWAGRCRRVDIEDLARLLADDALALAALAGVVEGRIRVPRNVGAQLPLSRALASAAGVRDASLTGAVS